MSQSNYNLTNFLVGLLFLIVIGVIVYIFVIQPKSNTTTSGDSGNDF